MLFFNKDTRMGYRWLCIMPYYNGARIYYTRRTLIRKQWLHENAVEGIKAFRTLIDTNGHIGTFAADNIM